MRISMNENSPHYKKDHYLYEVFLDGVKVEYGIEACEETGRIWILNPSLSFVVRHGIVTIVKREL